MHWKEFDDDRETVLFCDQSERYGHYGLFELGIEIFQQENYEVLEQPSAFYECTQEEFSLDHKELAIELKDDQQICRLTEYEIDDLYFMAETGPPNYYDLEGWGEFALDVNHFQSINYLWWIVVGWCGWFDAGEHSIGLSTLKADINHFCSLNPIGLWSPDYNKSIDLDYDFWYKEIEPHA